MEMLVSLTEGIDTLISPFLFLLQGTRYREQTRGELHKEDNDTKKKPVSMNRWTRLLYAEVYYIFFELI
jgi:hypothetical protein